MLCRLVYIVCKFDQSRHLHKPYHSFLLSESNFWRVKIDLKIVTAAIALFMFAGAAGLATAQDTTKTTHKKTRTLTGCLKKGEDANQYDFIAKGGGTWEIKSDSIKLDEHVGHTVKITA